MGIGGICRKVGQRPKKGQRIMAQDGPRGGKWDTATLAWLAPPACVNMQHAWQHELYSSTAYERDKHIKDSCIEATCHRPTPKRQLCLFVFAWERWDGLKLLGDWIGWKEGITRPDRVSWGWGAKDRGWEGRLGWAGGRREVWVSWG